MINGVRWVRVRGWRGQMGLGLELHTFRRDRNITDNNFKEKKLQARNILSYKSREPQGSKDKRRIKVFFPMAKQQKTWR